MKIHQKYKSISNNPEFVKVTYTIHVHNIYSKTFDTARFLAEILVFYKKKWCQKALSGSPQQNTFCENSQIPHSSTKYALPRANIYMSHTEAVPQPSEDNHASNMCDRYVHDEGLSHPFAS